MSGIHTRIITDAHGYTRSKTPWIVDEYKSAYGKLIHYISGGGMKTFGRTVSQEEARSKHVRFMSAALAVGLLWLLFYIF